MVEYGLLGQRHEGSDGASPVETYGREFPAEGTADAKPLSWGYAEVL